MEDLLIQDIFGVCFNEQIWSNGGLVYVIYELMQISDIYFLQNENSMTIKFGFVSQDSLDI